MQHQARDRGPARSRSTGDIHVDHPHAPAPPDRLLGHGGPVTPVYVRSIGHLMGMVSAAVLHAATSVLPVGRRSL